MSVDVGAVVAARRDAFRAGTTRPLRWRREQLLNLQRMLEEQSERWARALHADLGKSETEAHITEIGFCVGEIRHILKHLDDWVEPERVKVPVSQKPGRAEIVNEPLGVVLIVSPWNYPLHLLVAPLAAALAAGNAVVCKPSELAPATSAELASLLPQYLDTEAVAVVEGGPEVATALLDERVDHVFFTGSTAIGRKVMAAAARHLTPVTLELGGKSPAIVDRSARLDVTAKRIVLGRFMNAGQTCVAPDHVLVDEEVESELCERMVAAVHDFFGDDPAASADLGRIVNDRHVARLQGLLDGGGYEEVLVGGDVDAASRYVAPTILRGVRPDAPVMGEEIFGPILPVLGVPSLDDAIDAVNAGEKPLALYVFAEDDDAVEAVLERTSSGGVCVNHTLLQLGVPDLPFGGVGESGTGAYHGRAGFDALSHRKSVFRKSTRPDPSIVYPPYGRWKSKVIRAAT
ncbi:aldehyde dehydrogenase family protein [Actinomarinicola tropica]|uniref:Aldehyde dehydrogenase n=1 Tax=Actinomarinicola tropica TaxID=2789776 RepID=A0A5Q2RPF1_9ACTN|nr:aldehyde dehydrogenase family protein [Actinomarinicola tropica]QGG96316.1 aldehyde dehydrogenase family protein [Actinomarinicola tropica]